MSARQPREYGATSVVAVSLEVMCVEVVELSPSGDRWTCLPKAVIASGAPVILHAQGPERQRAQTEPFVYLSVVAPRTQQCS